MSVSFDVSIQWHHWLELLVHLILWAYCMICVIGDKNFPDPFQNCGVCFFFWGGGGGRGTQTLHSMYMLHITCIWLVAPTPFLLASSLLPLPLKYCYVISLISPSSHHFKLSLAPPPTPRPYSPRFPTPCFTSMGSITFPLNYLMKGWGRRQCQWLNITVQCCYT